ncbi:ABC transporter ATP-binding protein [Cumulibacter soli]|uniref:ABC transporter ATP-binding protein n=1 Tax=Cumulibacter soli TaxID=2546344 RepID=UPI001ABAB526|nr:ABC transporter ATP-binding protein [Cumulibacter soli]
MDLEIENLNAWHTARGQRAATLMDVAFSIPAGELGAVLGPSGSGKTTLLRVIAGLHRDASGSIQLGDNRLDGRAPQHRKIGLVPQDGALFPHLSVVQNIEFGLPRAQRRGRRTADMLDLLSLRPYADRLPHQLSGGQAQRVAVARALAPGPRLVLLDEPFSALDAALRSEVGDGVRNALADTGTTALLVTHDQSEALSLSRQLIVIDAGRVRQTGAPDEVYAHPADLWTGQFLGDANTLAAVSDGTIAQTAIGPLRHQPTEGGPVTVLIRPEQVSLAVGSDGATVRSTRYFGHDCLVSVELDGGGTILARGASCQLPAVGARVAITVDGLARAYRRADSPTAPAESSNDVAT